jgi:hypothetical protein
MIDIDENGDIDGPIDIYGYDGKIHLERATARQWRAHRLRLAREGKTTTQAQWNALQDRAGVVGSTMSSAKAHTFWSDWLGDPAVRALTPAERGLWIILYTCGCRRSTGYIGRRGSRYRMRRWLV